MPRAREIQALCDLSRITKYMGNVNEDNLEEIVSTLSHEMRSPVAIVKGALDNLTHHECGELNQLQKKMVSMAARQCDRLLRMIQNILELGRLNSGEAKVTAEPVQVSQLLDAVRGELQMLAAQNRIDLVVKIDGEFSAIAADHDLVTQVLHNLIGNALRFARHQVVLRAREYGDGVRISVEDDGPGIVADAVAQLFGAYQQVDRVQDAAGYKGTGLGLAICRRILELHSGKIWVESSVGHGATFHCFFPYQLSAIPPLPLPTMSEAVAT